MAPIRVRLSAAIHLHIEAAVPQPPAQITFSPLSGWLALDELDINVPPAMPDGFVVPLLPPEAFAHEVKPPIF